jgi:hypothetical protein
MWTCALLEVGSMLVRHDVPMLLGRIRSRAYSSWSTTSHFQYLLRERKWLGAGSAIRREMPRRRAALHLRDTKTLTSNARHSHGTKDPRKTGSNPVGLCRRCIIRSLQKSLSSRIAGAPYGSACRCVLQM